jgi:hypothetical protein
VKELPHFDTVILGAQWASYEDMSGSNLEKDFKHTLELLRGKRRVIVMAQVPAFEKYVPDCELRQIRLPNMRCQERSSSKDKGDLTTNKKLSEIAADFKNVEFINVRSLICSDGTCSPYLHGQPIYYNKTHLSMWGSRALALEFLSRDPAAKKALE